MQETYFSIPELCPACSGPTVLEGDFLFCRSKACPEKLSGSVRVWIRNLGILYWGDALIDALTDPDNPKIKSVADLYNLTVDDLAECSSGKKMAKKCHDILHANKSLPLELVLASLNIPNFGISTSTDVVQAGFDTVEKVLNTDFNDLKGVPNIGEKTALYIQEGIMIRRDLILELSNVLDIKPPAQGSLSGKTICITGDLSAPRKAVEKAIMSVGGSPKGSVSKNTSFLVTNQPDVESSKMKKAKKYGTPIIDEAELMRIIGMTPIDPSPM
jgi:DNA ligase (NAD+)